MNWLNILRREVKNFEGTRQNNSVTSEEGIPFRGDIKERELSETTSPPPR